MAEAVSLPIAVDGVYQDWGDGAPVHVDPSGDEGGSAVDFGRLFIAHDEHYLYLRFEIGTEMIINTGNYINLYLDWDNNTQTGANVEGIGADLRWRFGLRQGTYYGNETETFYWNRIDLRRAPTVSSDQYEIAISRFPDLAIGEAATTISLVFRNEDNGVKDKLPDSGAVIYALSSDPLPSHIKIPLDKKKASDLRIVTYNVLNDGFFYRTEYFTRILQALDPDIINFQEIYNHTAEETRALVASILPLSSGEEWYAASNNDCKTVSRFPVLNKWNLDGNLVVEISAPFEFSSDSILIVNAHLPAGDNQSQRQAEIDRIMSFIKDAKMPGGSVNIASRTPMILLGDMNLVGWAQQLSSLLEGDIVDEETFGADFSPDWDGSEFKDCLSYHTSSRESFTWRSNSSSYDPGRLDFIIYTDSILETPQHYIVYTPEMDEEDLTQYGLQSGDVPSASDHLPHVADFGFRNHFNLWMFR
ncbi:endonuclease/exonuclease/phosphatase family protein [Candidatus Sumerlaeota bacterium]|nr:endonuclease/exonuclease/phosphatase family protein [Candidatus Sumerlaeota bacterium]